MTANIGNTHDLIQTRIPCDWTRIPRIPDIRCHLFSGICGRITDTTKEAGQQDETSFVTGSKMKRIPFSEKDQERPHQAHGGEEVLLCNNRNTNGNIFIQVATVGWYKRSLWASLMVDWRRFEWLWILGRFFAVGGVVLVNHGWLRLRLWVAGHSGVSCWLAVETGPSLFTTWFPLWFKWLRIIGGWLSAVFGGDWKGAPDSWCCDCGVLFLLFLLVDCWLSFWSWFNWLRILH